MYTQKVYVTEFDVLRNLEFRNYVMLGIQEFTCYY